MNEDYRTKHERRMARIEVATIVVGIITIVLQTLSK